MRAAALDEWVEDVSAMNEYGWPIALSSLSSIAMQLVDVVVVGRMLGVPSLVAVCLCQAVVNLALEPSCFIINNAITMLCAGAVAQSNAQLWYLWGALLFSLLIALPIVASLLSMPLMLLSPLAAALSLPAEVAEGIRAYAPCYLSLIHI